MFLNNFNVMLLVMIVALMLGIALQITEKMHKNKKLNNIGKTILKQGLMTLVIFNIYNASFSAGI
jgi:uncharacterized membrane protein affecting hemolysin expression